MNTIKGVIFDYGGTIDTDGVHWGIAIWEQYRRVGVPVDNALFREAYVHAERTLGKNHIIEPDDTFHTLLEKKIALQARFLRKRTTAFSREQEEEIVRLCYQTVTQTLETTIGVLEKISHRYPLVLVTNFYGNMPVVLREFSLCRYFKDIIESAVVGFRKPDPALFALGANALGIPPENILVAGDSYRKDICPALTLGCHAVWLKKKCWEQEKIIDGMKPDAIISTLAELPPLLASQP